MTESQKNVAEKPRFTRRLPVGADLQPHGGVHFRVWAPKCQRVSVQTKYGGSEAGRPLSMSRDQDGYFSAIDDKAAAGDQYWYFIDGDDYRLPDPASRFQPEGPHGPSEIIDPAAYAWQDGKWPGVDLPGQVIYELHVGTLTPEGTWAAAERELPELQAAGITLLEIMPVATFPGKFNWGYDGVDLFAPSQLYGRPDDMRRFVDTAHLLGMGVILDVVYNHVGPDGNYLKRFADEYFTDRYETDWGEAINYDGQGSGPVREFMIHNAGYWIDEFHLDGLRLDATQNIYDQSDDHVITALTRHARSQAAGRSIVVVAENEPQDTQLVRPPENGGYGLDGMWNDDFHHSALVALSKHNEAYYSDFLGTARELLATAKHGFIYQGQWSQWQENRRGTATRGVPPWTFITFLENHDQVSNSLRGLRVHQLTSPSRYRAMTGLWLLGPGTPMLFQGQEFGATTPNLFFADHHKDLAPLVHRGRKDFLSQFPSIATEESQAAIDDPVAESTFLRCKLDLSERQRNAPVYQMHKDLLRLRREEHVLRACDERSFDGAVLGDRALILRYFDNYDRNDRLLIVNLGPDYQLCPLPEPLLAAPRGLRWMVRWSSEDVDYGGCGTPEVLMNSNCKLPGETTLWLALEEERDNG